jgi:hypothetical protein
MCFDGAPAPSKLVSYWGLAMPYISWQREAAAAVPATGSSVTGNDMGLRCYVTARLAYLR